MRLLLLAWRNLQRNRQNTPHGAVRVVWVLASIVLQGLACNAFVDSLIDSEPRSKPKSARSDFPTGLLMLMNRCA